MDNNPVHIGTFDTILNPHAVQFLHILSSAHVDSKQLDLMSKKFYENFMLKGVKSCVKDSNVNQAN